MRNARLYLRRHLAKTTKPSLFKQKGDSGILRAKFQKKAPNRPVSKAMKDFSTSEEDELALVVRCQPIEKCDD